MSIEEVQAGPSGDIPGSILQYFDLVSTPYDASFASKLKGRKASYPGGSLFFEKLLDLESIQATYPPTTPASLRKLLQAIVNSDSDRTRQDCYYYYLLRDYDFYDSQEVNGNKTRAAEFAKRRCLSSPWVVLIDAFWYLDNEQWESAIDSLVDPRITGLNFSTDIIDLISTHVSPPSRSLAYIQRLVKTTPHIPLTDDTLSIRLVALASTSSLDDAFSLIRSSSPQIQASLREELWSWLSGAPKKPAGAGQHSPQGHRIKELVHLPLSQEELDHLISFLARPLRGVAPETVSVLHDLVTLRLVHQGQYAEAIQLDRDSAGSVGKDSDRQRRREMVREFITILPDVQRRALAIEGDERAGRRALERENGTLTNGDVHMDSTPINDTPKRAPYPSLGIEGSLSRPHSPFTGPPRFASGQQSPGLLQRVLSGPFALPRQASSSSPAPRRRVIEDDLSESSERPHESVSGHEDPVQETQTEADEEEESVPVSSEPPRRSKRIVSSSKPAEAKTPSPRRTRRTSVSAPSASAMPGSFSQPEPVPENAVLETAPAKSTRSRTTRSVSRAFGEEERTARKKPKTRSNRDKAPATPPRRTTRASTRASSAIPSEMGSPTPSVTSTIGRRNMRGSSVASQTPRATRSRK